MKLDCVLAVRRGAIAGMLVMAAICAGADLDEATERNLDVFLRHTQSTTTTARTLDDSLDTTLAAADRKPGARAEVFRRLGTQARPSAELARLLARRRIDELVEGKPAGPALDGAILALAIRGNDATGIIATMRGFRSYLPDSGGGLLTRAAAPLMPTGLVRQQNAFEGLCLHTLQARLRATPGDATAVRLAAALVETSDGLLFATRSAFLQWILDPASPHSAEARRVTRAMVTHTDPGIALAAAQAELNRGIVDADVLDALARIAKEREGKSAAAYQARRILEYLDAVAAGRRARYVPFVEANGDTRGPATEGLVDFTPHRELPTALTADLRGRVRETLRSFPDTVGTQSYVQLVGLAPPTPPAPTDDDPFDSTLVRLVSGQDLTVAELTRSLNDPIESLVLDAVRSTREPGEPDPALDNLARLATARPELRAELRRLSVEGTLPESSRSFLAAVLAKLGDCSGPISEMAPPSPPPPGS